MMYLAMPLAEPIWKSSKVRISISVGCVDKSFQFPRTELGQLLQGIHENKLLLELFWERDAANP